MPLEQIRERIDSVDAQLHALINERAQAGAAGRRVEARGRPHRRFLPAGARGAGAAPGAGAQPEEGGPLRDEEVLRLFREIMSACLAQQNALKIGYLGPEGTFTQQAVLKYFGHSVRPLPLTSVEEVFHEVESGAADFGVVPIENSTEGTVNNTLDMFLTSPLKICGEVELRIHQNLMGRMTMLGDIRRVCGAPAVAGAVPRLAAGTPARRGARDRSAAMPKAHAAHATRTARRRSPALRRPRFTASNLLVPEIEDRPDNTTRFLVIGRKAVEPERCRQDHAAGVGCEDRCARRAVSPARTPRRELASA